jgi:hypothetical protein
MLGDHTVRWSSIWLRLGIVAGACTLLMGAIVLVGAIFLLTQPASQAAPPPVTLSAPAAAVDKSDGQVRLLVRLQNSEEKPVQGTLHLELLGPDGKSLAKADQDVDQAKETDTYRVAFPAQKVRADQLTVRARFHKDECEVGLGKILLPKGHETTLASSQEFQTGSTAAIRCEVRGVKSLTETVPLSDSDVEVRLIAKQAKKADKVIALYNGKTGADGSAAPQFKVPALPPGQYTLEVATRSGLGEEKLTRDVQVKEGTKILLTTDKPLYQPGQLMHIRALALRPFDLSPVAKSDLVFEVEDAKGNKVFKRPLRTSEHGIAAIDFQLADEVNMGDYRVRATIGEHQSDKTVAVKKYVLPKFKNELKADKRFYLPKEKIEAELQTDYFFGKPVAEGKVKVTASTFDVQFKEFQTWEGKTDAHGHAKFTIQLPDYFVGQPLQKGNAIVKLDVKVTDTADHSETLTRTYPVSDQPIRVSLIPEGGRLVPGMENRVFAAAIYPDGSPAPCNVHLWFGREAKDKPFASVTTNEAGLAEFRITPKAEQFRGAQWEQQHVEMLGGQQVPAWGQKSVLDLFAEAKDKKGNAARALSELNRDPLGENVLLRLDKAIYQGGDAMNVDIRTSAGLPTVYLDVIRNGQTLLTKWLDVKDGKAAQKLELPTTVFGTLEVHAYQMLKHGEIIRDSRVVYVHPREDLKIEVKADQDEYLPGGEGKIHFQVTDAAGNPTAAALGVIIVDEAVYALQEMQPGLEKVYFTLQEELLKPQTEVLYKPAESIDTLVREPILAADKQQIAEVLLTSVRPKPPARWQVEPAFQRRVKAESQVQVIGMALYQQAWVSDSPVERDAKAKTWHFKAGLLQDAVKANLLQADMLKDPFDNALTLDDLAKLDEQFTPDRLAKAITLGRMQQLAWPLFQYTQANQAKWFKDNKWSIPESALEEAAKAHNLTGKWLQDGWGRPIRLIKRDKKLTNPFGGWTQFEYHEFVSAGPDGKFDTADDVRSSAETNWGLGAWWWVKDQQQLAKLQQAQWHRGRDGRWRGMEVEQLRMLGAGGPPPGVPGAAPAAGNGGLPVPDLGRVEKAALKEDRFGDDKGKGDAGQNGGPAAPPVRIREYFPETMLWQPALITDDKGVAILPVTFADSITTWRLSASASSKGGALGGVSAPLRVFQEFFVDLDLPVSLTQNDEVAFPVAVYNYLKTPQTVKLELQDEKWFDLADENGFTRTLNLKPNEVTAVKFRIRAKRIGSYPLTVKANGSKHSDAIKRFIDIVPDGQRVEQVISDRLAGRVTQTVTIPEHALPDSSKLVVKVYPGVMSQVLEGTEGMLRLPGG